MPRLARRWRVALPIRPGSDPFSALAQMLLETSTDAERADLVASLAARLHAEAGVIANDPTAVPDLLMAYARTLRGSASRILISIDQAEELFTQPSGGSGQLLWRYVQRLHVLDSSVFLAVTVRPEQLTDLQETMGSSKVPVVAVGVMAAHNMRDAILGPAGAAGVASESGWSTICWLRPLLATRSPSSACFCSSSGTGRMAPFAGATTKTRDGSSEPSPDTPTASTGP